jgi:hypothetical protein
MFTIQFHSILLLTNHQYPGDAKYPTKTDWDSLKTTVLGNLIQTLADARRNFQGNRTVKRACAGLASGSFDNSPVLIKSSWWYQYGCSNCPCRYSSGICSLGNHPAYVVRARSAKDIQTAVRFANKFNLRLVVKNTGHDFLGRLVCQLMSFQN